MYDGLEASLYPKNAYRIGTYEQNNSNGSPFLIYLICEIIFAVAALGQFAHNATCAFAAEFEKYTNRVRGTIQNYFLSRINKFPLFDLRRRRRRQQIGSEICFFFFLKVHSRLCVAVGPGSAEFEMRYFSPIQKLHRNLIT